MTESAVLFLQGPLGPFFKQLARTFSKAGYTTHKINFNGGDRLFSWAHVQTQYKGKPADWAAFLKQYLIKHSIEAVFLMGDCRYYHRTAKPVCDALGVKFCVFEEGYLRPDTITLEPQGVNSLSQMALNREKLEKVTPCSAKSSQSIGGTMKRRTVYAAFYYWASCFFRDEFSEYRHHRASHPVKEGFYWLRGFARKWLFKSYDQQMQFRLDNEFDQRFYLVPLQVHDDSQMIFHSPYESVKAFIQEVMTSFWKYADSDKILCLKHHPMDRGYTDYGQFIESLATQLGIQDRVLYCHDIPLPDLYHHTCGVITVNSTVGISALLHHLPTKVMGRAFYDIEGITHQGSLKSFWSNPQPVDRHLFKQLHTFLFQKTQINGSFFKYYDLTCKNSLAFYEAHLKPISITQHSEQDTHSPSTVAPSTSSPYSSAA
ncbi:capsule biosynthesis protein [Endozoicomonas numazuensis]|uniref:capsule biosynthesis protein n=1 Tax=Endozoicomonas numazuensis TaxID=1137799 RepID=UPI00068A4779|nr:capsular biosynthesis protein [Endozoicomonas numazuensis]